MAVDRRCNGSNDFLGDVWLFGQPSDLVFVVISQINHVFVTLSLQVVDFHDGLENGEAVLHILEVVKHVNVDSSDFYLVTGSRCVDQVVQHEAFLLARHTARRHAAWRLLDGQLLVVAVDGLHFVKNVRSVHAADDTSSEVLSCLVNRSVRHRSFDITARAAEVHFLELREHTGALGDDSLELDERIQVHLSQVSKLVFNWQVSHSHVDFRVDAQVLRINFLDCLTSDFIENWEHVGRLFGEPNREGGLLARKMRKVDFNGLLVVLAHFLDPAFVDMLLLVVLEGPQKVSELSSDEETDFFFLQPSAKFALAVRVVVDLTEIGIVVVTFFFQALHSQLCLTSGLASLQIGFGQLVVIHEGIRSPQLASGLLSLLVVEFAFYLTSLSRL